jgi:uncharacterized repeat protein (TIGR01451 family)
MNHKYLYLLIFCLLIPFTFTAQVCNDYSNQVLATQSQVDQFIANNPTPNSIQGNINICNFPPDPNDPITNLDSFLNISSIDGRLFITNEPESEISLIGLQNLTTVNGILGISYGSDLTGLDNLTSVDTLSLVIKSLTGLNHLDAINDIKGLDINCFLPDTVPTLDIFPNVTTIERIWIEYFEHVPAFSGFNALESASYIELYGIHADQFDAFRNLEELEGGLLFLVSDCASFQGFDRLKNAGSTTVYLGNIQNQVNLFPEVESANILEVQLVNTDVVLLDSVSAFSGDFNYGVVDAAINLSHLISINGSLTDLGSSQIQINAPLLEFVSGDITITNSEIENLNFLSNAAIGGAVTIEDCPNLSDCAVQGICEKIQSNPELLSIANNGVGCNTMAQVAEACAFSYVTGLVYADIDCNGEYGSGDVVIPNPIILENGSLPIGGNGSEGDYYINLADNTTLTFGPQPIAGLLPVPALTVATSSSDSSFTGYDFALCPDGTFHDLSVAAYSNLPPKPGFSIAYNIIVTNHSTNVSSGTVVFDFSNMQGASFEAGFGAIVSGNTASFNVPSIGFMEQATFQLLLQMSASASLGTAVTPLLTVALNDNTDQNLSNNTYTWNQTVVGSYDPNDITVNIEAQNFTELPTEGLTLDYTIRFQNTGTAPAEFVRVRDIIEEDLNLGSIQILSSSYPFQLSFNENREVEWLFDNIQLPDSTSDLEGSQGYIHYRIKTNPDVMLGDVIENTAAIYFDYNEPVITNTATTIFCICPDQIVATGTTVVCEGQSIEMTASAGWDNYQWTLGNELVGDQSTLSLGGLTAGIYNLNYSGSTPYCESADGIELDILDIPQAPTVTQNGNALIAYGSGLFTWMLDGVLLDEMSNTLIITESGNYSVMVTTNGCESEMTSNDFTFIGVEELGSGKISVYPNPSNGVFTLTLTDDLVGSQIFVTDMFGKTALNPGMAKSRNSTIEATTLANGIYQIRVGLVSRMLIIQ